MADPTWRNGMDGWIGEVITAFVVSVIALADRLLDVYVAALIADPLPIIVGTVMAIWALVTLLKPIGRLFRV